MRLGLPDFQPTPGPGISRQLAQARAATVTALTYQVTLRIPESRVAPVTGTVSARFTYSTKAPIVLDFRQPPDHVRDVWLDGHSVRHDCVDGHIILAEAPRASDTEVMVEFVAGDAPLNRHDDFLYSLFVPARAHQVVPLFDQPDLKARFTLTLDIPRGWDACSNASVAEEVTSASRRTVRFCETAPISTYLFAFVAGVFTVETATRDGRALRIYHRETEPDGIRRNLGAIFELHRTALAFMEGYLDYPYPFEKFDVVLIPSFQFGGMEHPGIIYYKAASVMLESSATEDQHLSRASLIAHETAHMWFGDLVTMQWFDEVWLKEVFASLMADKIVGPAFPEIDHDLHFMLAHHPPAYEVDRTPGTHAVQQSLANLDEAGQLYGAIVYHKAPIAMRQLEGLVGPEAFREGLCQFVREYAFGTATWADLMRVLDRRSHIDLIAWSRAWIESAGRPAYSVSTLADGPGDVKTLAIEGRDTGGDSRVWPQRLSVLVGDGREPVLVRVAIRAPVTSIDSRASNLVPAYVLPNADGWGYGRFDLDERTWHYLLEHIESLPSGVHRGSAWIALWDALMESTIAAEQWLDAAERVLLLERNEQLVHRILEYAARVWWQWLEPDVRGRRAPQFERVLLSGLANARSVTARADWFRAFRSVVLTPRSVRWLERVWNRDEPVPGLSLEESDESGIAMDLAVREVSGWKALLEHQSVRIRDPERRSRFDFVRPALSADSGEREATFSQLVSPAYRRREPWVLEVLTWLNHPLRQEHARRFIDPALTLLTEIQRTGDIFFPMRWAGAALAGHQSEQARRAVEDFLAREETLPVRLRSIVLVAADHLFRVHQRSSTIEYS